MLCCIAVRAPTYHDHQIISIALMMPKNNATGVPEGIIVESLLRGCWMFVGSDG